MHSRQVKGNGKSVVPDASEEISTHILTEHLHQQRKLNFQCW